MQHKKGDMVDIIMSGRPFHMVLTPEMEREIHKEITIRRRVDAVEIEEEVQRRLRERRKPNGAK